MNIGFGNNIKSATTAIITSTSTIIPVTTGTGSQFSAALVQDSDLSNGSITPTLYSKITLSDSGETVFEICHLLSVSGDNLTVLRAQEGTSALSWSLNSIVFNGPTRGSENNFVQVEDLQNGKYLSATAGGTANALTVSIPSTFYKNSGNTLALNSTLIIYPILTNTGPCTLSLTISGTVIGTFNLLKTGGLSLVAGDISSGVPFLVNYLPSLSSCMIISATPTLGRLLNIQTFTSSGNYTPSPGTTLAIVEVLAAGGSGASGAANGTGYYSGGGGGCSGSYLKFSILISALTTPVTVTIGAGGSSVTNAAGIAGGNTSFGSYATVLGGNGGLVYVSSAAIPGIYGMSPTRTSYTLSSSAKLIDYDYGQCGGDCIIQVNGVRGGFGAPSKLGGSVSGAGINTVGNSALTPGGGGSGVASNSGAGYASGSGFRGYIKVWEYA